MAATQLLWDEMGKDIELKVIRTFILKSIHYESELQNRQFTSKYMWNKLNRSIFKSSITPQVSKNLRDL